MNLAAILRRHRWVALLSVLLLAPVLVASTHAPVRAVTSRCVAQGAA